MGYYINGNSNLGKADYIVDNHGGRIVSQAVAEEAMSDPTLAVVAVKHNGPFDAAGYCYNMDEFKEFSHPDHRRTTWVVLSRGVANRLTGYLGDDG